jgi:PAS domain S-box-containing protein
MEQLVLSRLLARQLRKLQLSAEAPPADVAVWREFLEKVSKTYGEYDEARISTDNVLAVSLREMELMQMERAKLNADKLQELNANLSVVLQASELGVWDWNLQTNEVAYDKRWCEILGYHIEELAPSLQTFESLCHPDDVRRVLGEADDYIQKKAPRFDVKFRMRHKSGDWVDIHAKGRILNVGEQGQPLRFMGTHDDVTAELRMHREMEAQKSNLLHQSKLASLGEMSAGIAHEINNPLAIIIGSAELLTIYRENEQKFTTKIDLIYRSCDRISKILNGLKKYSRTADDTKHAVKNLCAIVDEVVVLTEIKAKRTGVNVRRECPEELLILCDEISIEQVLINLINNGIDAVKNVDDKWVRVTVHAEGEDIFLRVIDSGPMIDQELEQKIFDPFFTTKKVGEGTGLGLSITKGILDEHSAQICLNRSFSTTCFEIQFKRFVGKIDA